MRLVAMTLPALLLLTVLPIPALAVDECRSVGAACQRVSTEAAPDASAQKVYYVFADGLRCPTNPACRAADEAAAYGLLWEESNGLDGLQRSGMPTPAGYKTADTVVLA